MTYLLYLLLGMLIGSLLTHVILKMAFRIAAGRGKFRLIPVENEGGFYRVNVQLMTDPEMGKKKYILLSRE